MLLINLICIFNLMVLINAHTISKNIGKEDDNYDTLEELNYLDNNFNSKHRLKHHLDSRRHDPKLEKENKVKETLQFKTGKEKDSSKLETTSEFNLNKFDGKKTDDTHKCATKCKELCSKKGKVEENKRKSIWTRLKGIIIGEGIKKDCVIKDGVIKEAIKSFDYKNDGFDEDEPLKIKRNIVGFELFDTNPQNEDDEPKETVTFVTLDSNNKVTDIITSVVTEAIKSYQQNELFAKKSNEKSYLATKSHYHKYHKSHKAPITTTFDELPATAQIEVMLNEIKKKSLIYLSNVNPVISNLVTNTVTEATYEADPLIYHDGTKSGFSLTTFVSVNDNPFNTVDKRKVTPIDTFNNHFILTTLRPNAKESRSVTKDFYEIAQIFDNKLQKNFKKQYNNLKKMVTNELISAETTLKKKICSSSSDSSDKINKLKSMSATTAKISKAKTTPQPKSLKMPFKKIHANNLDKSNKAINTLKHKGIHSNIKDSSNKITEPSNHMEIHADNADGSNKAMKTLKHLDDDYNMLSLYEQLLNKANEYNILHVLPNLSQYKRKSNKFNEMKISKRNVETLADLNLKKSMKMLNDDDGDMMPDETLDYDVLESSTTEEDTDSTSMDSIENISNKIAYADYVNGFKHYLKYQREFDLGERKFSNLIRYQAHRHHDVDSIGKYILEKLPEVPRMKSKRDAFDVTTKADKSWFKKNFYAFIDKGTGKKYHTSQTVTMSSLNKDKQSTSTEKVSNLNSEAENTVVNENKDINLNESINHFDYAKSPYSEENRMSDEAETNHISTNAKSPIKGDQDKKQSNNKNMRYNFFNTIFASRHHDKDFIKRQDSMMDDLVTNIDVYERFKRSPKLSENNLANNAKDIAYVNINLVKSTTGRRNLAAKKKKKKKKAKNGKLHHFFNLFRKERAKEKRDVQRTPRFHPFKKLKQYFYTSKKNKPNDFDIFDTKLDAFKPLHYNKISMYDLQKQIPNVTGVDEIEKELHPAELQQKNIPESLSLKDMDELLKEMERKASQISVDDKLNDRHFLTSHPKSFKSAKTTAVDNYYGDLKRPTNKAFTNQKVTANFKDKLKLPEEVEIAPKMNSRTRLRPYHTLNEMKYEINKIENTIRLHDEVSTSPRASTFTNNINPDIGKDPIVYVLNKKNNYLPKLGTTPSKIDNNDKAWTTSPMANTFTKSTNPIYDKKIQSHVFNKEKTYSPSWANRNFKHSENNINMHIQHKVYSNPIIPNIHGNKDVEISTVIETPQLHEDLNSESNDGMEFLKKFMALKLANIDYNTDDTVLGPEVNDNYIESPSNDDKLIDDTTAMDYATVIDGSPYTPSENGIDKIVEPFQGSSIPNIETLQKEVNALLKDTISKYSENLSLPSNTIISTPKMYTPSVSYGSKTARGLTVVNSKLFDDSSYEKLINTFHSNKRVFVGKDKVRANLENNKNEKKRNYLSDANSQKLKQTKPATKSLTRPMQFYTTPLPMNRNDFDRFLKEEALDVITVTSPLQFSPDILAKELKENIQESKSAIDAISDNLQMKLIKNNNEQAEANVTTPNSVFKVKAKSFYSNKDNPMRIKKKMRLFQSHTDTYDNTNKAVDSDKYIEISNIPYLDKLASKLNEMTESFKNAESYGDSLFKDKTATYERLNRPIHVMHMHNELFYNHDPKEDLFSNSVHPMLNFKKSLLEHTYPKRLQLSGKSYRYDIIYETDSQEGIAKRSLSKPDVTTPKDKSVLEDQKLRLKNGFSKFKKGYKMRLQRFPSLRFLPAPQHHWHINKYWSNDSNSINKSRRTNVSKLCKKFGFNKSNFKKKFTNKHETVRLTGKYFTDDNDGDALYDMADLHAVTANLKYSTTMNKNVMNYNSNKDSKVKDVIKSDPKEKIYKKKKKTINIKHKIKSRQVTPQVHTAKNVETIEIILDLIKETGIYGEKHESTISFFQRNKDPRKLASSDRVTNDISTTSTTPLPKAIEVHIAVPYNLQSDSQKRGLEPVRVRKVFSAKMATPVDIEYQIGSFEEYVTTQNPKSFVSKQSFLEPGNKYVLVEDPNLPKGYLAIKPLNAVVNEGLHITSKNGKVMREVKTTDQTKTTSLKTTEQPETSTLKPNTKTFGRVTLNKDIILALNKEIVAIYENLTNIKNFAPRMAEVKKTTKKSHIFSFLGKFQNKEQSRRKRRTWKSIKKFFGHERVCSCKCRENRTMCRACAESDAVASDIIFAFDNLAKFINDHCTEVQTFFWMNPIAGRKLRDKVRQIDKTLDNYFKRVKGTCQGKPCELLGKTFEKRSFTYSTNMVKRKASDFRNSIRQCGLHEQRLKSNGKSVQTVYSLDNVNVNIICTDTKKDLNYTKMPTSTINVINHYPSDKIENNKVRNMQSTDNEFTQSENVLGSQNGYDTNMEYYYMEEPYNLKQILKDKFVIQYLPIPSKSANKSKIKKIYTKYKNKQWKRNNTQKNKKRDLNYLPTQMNSPLITDTDRSFWYDYLKKGTPPKERIVRDTNTLTNSITRNINAATVFSTTSVTKANLKSSTSVESYVDNMNNETSEIMSLSKHLTDLLKLFQTLLLIGNEYDNKEEYYVTASTDVELSKPTLTEEIKEPEQNSEKTTSHDNKQEGAQVTVTEHNNKEDYYVTPSTVAELRKYTQKEETKKTTQNIDKTILHDVEGFGAQVTRHEYNNKKENHVTPSSFLEFSKTTRNEEIKKTTRNSETTTLDDIGVNGVKVTMNEYNIKEKYYVTPSTVEDLSKTIETKEIKKTAQCSKKTKLHDIKGYGAQVTIDVSEIFIEKMTTKRSKTTTAKHLTTISNLTNKTIKSVTMKTTASTTKIKNKASSEHMTDVPVTNYPKITSPITVTKYDANIENRKLDYIKDINELLKTLNSYEYSTEGLSLPLLDHTQSLQELHVSLTSNEDIGTSVSNINDRIGYDIKNSLLLEILMYEAKDLNKELQKFRRLKPNIKLDESVGSDNTKSYDATAPYSSDKSTMGFLNSVLNLLNDITTSTKRPSSRGIFKRIADKFRTKKLASHKRSKDKKELQRSHGTDVKTRSVGNKNRPILEKLQINLFPARKNTIQNPKSTQVTPSGTMLLSSTSAPSKLTSHVLESNSAPPTTTASSVISVGSTKIKATDTEAATISSSKTVTYLPLFAASKAKASRRISSTPLPSSTAITKEALQPEDFTLCDIQATCKGIIKELINKGQLFENNIRNITCTKFMKAPKYFDIEVESPIEMDDNEDTPNNDGKEIKTEHKKTIRWDWIRNKRSLLSLKSEDGFELYERDEDGVFRRNVRRKRDAKIRETKKILGLPKIENTENHIFVIKGDNVTLNCIKNKKKRKRKDITQNRWTTERHDMLDYDNVAIDNDGIVINNADSKNEGGYKCKYGPNKRERSTRVTIMALPEYKILFQPSYITDNGCHYEDLKIIQKNLGGLMSEVLCSNTKCCSIKTEEPTCMKNRETRATELRTTIVLSPKPYPGVPCSVQCRRDINAGIAALFADNVPALVRIPVTIRNGDDVKTLRPDLTRDQKMRITHTMRKKEAVHHEAYRRIARSLAPGDVKVLMMCPAGYQLNEDLKICETCPMNTYSAEGTPCTSCPPGSRTLAPGGDKCVLLTKRQRRYDWMFKEDSINYIFGAALLLLAICLICIIKKCIVNICRSNTKSSKQTSVDINIRIDSENMSLKDDHFPPHKQKKTKDGGDMPSDSVKSIPIDGVGRLCNKSSTNVQLRACRKKKSIDGCKYAQLQSEGETSEGIEPVLKSRTSDGHVHFEEVDQIFQSLILRRKTPPPLPPIDFDI